MKVVKVTPSILTLNFERTLEKDVPVRPRLQGRPAPGHEVAEITSEPARVRISGPRSRVQEVESAFTEPVSLDGASQTVVETVNIGLEDPVLRLTGGSRVKVTARIREEHQPHGPRGPAPRGPGRDGPAASRQRPGRALRPRVPPPGPGRGEGQALRLGHARRPLKAPVAVELSSGLTGVTVVETVPAEVVPARRAQGKLRERHASARQPVMARTL